MRSAVFALVGVGLLAVSLPAAAQSTIYGATATVEEGVRVIRPQPPGVMNADGKEQISLGSGQPDTCRCNPTYLHRVGDATRSGRYLRRVLETQPLSGPR